MKTEEIRTFSLACSRCDADNDVELTEREATETGGVWYCGCGTTNQFAPDYPWEQGK